ncbi:MAG: hypothetical protein KAT62_02470 [Desulfuromonadales bacterium]|nr:hypothetical protein [Desulfuromonadales bacterium]
MKIKDETYTAAAVLISLCILTVKYDIITFGSASLNAGWISFEKIQVNEPYIIVAIVAFLLALSLIMHTKTMIPLLIDSYQKGYKSTKSLLEHVAGHVENLTGTLAHGSPYGSFKPSIIKKTIECGRFTSQNGLTSPLDIELPTIIHFKSLLSGLKETLKLRNIIFQFSPLIIGLWSLSEILI